MLVDAEDFSTSELVPLLIKICGKQQRSTTDVEQDDQQKPVFSLADFLMFTGPCNLKPPLTHQSRCVFSENIPPPSLFVSLSLDNRLPPVSVTLLLPIFGDVR